MSRYRARRGCGCGGSRSMCSGWTAKGWSQATSRCVRQVGLAGSDWRLPPARPCRWRASMCWRTERTSPSQAWGGRGRSGVVRSHLSRRLCGADRRAPALAGCGVTLRFRPHLQLSVRATSAGLGLGHAVLSHARLQAVRTSAGDR
jgi:hypothetical protein